MRDKIEAKNTCSSGWAKISASDSTKQKGKTFLFIKQTLLEFAGY